MKAGATAGSTDFPRLSAQINVRGRSQSKWLPRQVDGESSEVREDQLGGHDDLGRNWRQWFLAPADTSSRDNVGSGLVAYSCCTETATAAQA